MKHEKAIAGSNVLIQLITTEWSKASRGGEAAVQRGKVPIACQLPESLAPTPDGHLLLHTLTWQATNAFSNPLETTKVRQTSAGFQFQCAEVVETESGIKISWIWNASAGAPSRHAWRKGGNEFHAELKPSESVRIRWNGRFAYKDAWFYHSTTLNVGYWPSAEFPKDLFIATKPSHEFSRLAILW